MVADDAPEGLDAVFPGDFLAFFVGSASVGDGDFIDAPIALGNFGGNFGLEAEAVGFESDTLEDFATEDLVAGLHVGEFEVSEDVGEQGEGFVGDIMPEVVDALGSAEKAGAKDHVGSAVEDRVEKFVVVARVVFEIGILDEDNVTGDFCEAAAEGSAFSLVVGLEEDTKVAEVNRVAAVEGGRLSLPGSLKLGHFFEDLTGAVGGAVVHQYDFLAKRSVDDAAEDFVNGGFFVVNGNGHRQLRVHQGGGVATLRGHKVERKVYRGSGGGVKEEDWAERAMSNTQSGTGLEERQSEAELP